MLLRHRILLRPNAEQSVFLHDRFSILRLNIASADGEWLLWVNFGGILIVAYVLFITNLRPAP